MTDPYADVEDGSPCTQSDCDGTYEPATVENCSCHIAPPCGNCVEAGFTCDTCGHDTNPKYDPEPPEPTKTQIDRSNEITRTHVANSFNSTPFTNCCGVAAIDADRCPSCRAEIIGHDDGLAEARRLAKGGCLMCHKPLPKKYLGEAGTCVC